MKVLNFGSLNIDNVYKVDHFVRGGETLSSESLKLFCGGKGLNQSVTLGRAGIETYHAGSIGEDGTFLLDILHSAHVDTGCVRILREVRTGNAIIQNNREGENCILLYGGANQAITREQVDETLGHFAAGDYLILQNEINELSYIVESAHQKGMIIVLNPSPMDEKVLNLKLSCIDWFMLNEIEAGQLTGLDTTDAERLSPAMLARFPDAHIVLTLGGKGSCYADRRQVVRQGIYKVRTVDTTAAGDTFAGYFMAGIIRGETVKASLDMAARAAAITVSRPGAAPSIPTMQEVTDFRPQA